MSFCSFERVLVFKMMIVHVCADMGNGQPDDSRQVVTGEQPALNTTKLVLGQLDRTDLVLHIGDISYARGYASVVSGLYRDINV